MRQSLALAVALLLGCSATALAVEPSIAPGTTSPAFLAGEHAGDGLWQATAAGDVNGDGREDLVLSYSVIDGARPMSARAYVVFGDGTDAPVDLAALGTRGFAIDGPDDAAWSFSAVPGGDVNGDRLDDVLVSAAFASTPSRTRAGRVFVVFGADGADATTTVDLDVLGERGYEVYGRGAQAFAGSASSVRDLDGDERDELLVHESNPDRATLLFGKATTTPVDLGAIGAGGYRIEAPAVPGIDAVSGVGDVNGDGLEDLAFSGACGGGSCASGRTWVSFGKRDLDPVDLDALGGGGFSLTGTDLAGVGRAGDVNGDGRADIAVSDYNNGRAFVVFGRAATSPLSFAALGSAGFRIDRVDGVLKGVGDVDRDGLDDLADSSSFGSGGMIIFGKASSAPVDAGNLLDAGILLGGRTAGVGTTSDFGAGPRLFAAYFLDSPLGRAGAGSVRLFTPPAPSFELAGPLAYAAGGAIAPVAPMEQRRASPLSYSVAPALPDGLTLDPASGTIAGTPRQATAARPYTVTGRDRLGTTSRTISIRIDDPSYATLAPATAATTASRPLFAWSRASAPDDSEPVTAYTLMLDGAAYATLAAERCGERCELAAPSPIADGAHRWHVETTARDGHVRRTAAAELTVVDPPTARLALTRGAVHTGEPVGLDASSSSDPNGPIVRYEFDLDGDGRYEIDAGRDPRRVISYPSIGDRRVAVRVTDAGGSVAETSASLHVSPAPPAGELGVSVNDGAIATNDPNVTISLVWPRLADTALISNDGGFGAAGSTRELGLVARVPWRLASSGPERLPKIVYLRFRGGESGRETYTDDIILDQRSPQVVSAALAAAAGSPATASARRRGRSRAKKATLRVSVKDDNSGLRRVEVATRRGGRPIATKQLAPANHKGRRAASAQLRVPSGRGRLYVRVTDVAGNVSGWKAAARKRGR
ncbi:putative Ig domain-containing protein [Conexibacter woesei]|uniref:Ig family protein n=1 Tax=Conexibacter woesei (strain DSM 14684 / CCUG 47730 / CIP 108061 / JCM 11494 / NBRC 100937 / ID131577) TaxID=469383 RepID=D3FF28_CONWI|nr:putative Ig domain-containing protein [Conexibacter woesei]ADB51745.1 Ig family protein [Conexibacter woesei DSM 14684]